MAIQVIKSGTSTLLASSTAQPSIALGADIQDGDLAIAVHSIDYTMGATNLPTTPGFTLLQVFDTGDGAASLWYKELTAADANTSVTFTSAYNRVSLSLVVLRGAAIDAWAGWSSPTANTTHTIPGLTTTAPNTEHFVFYGTEDKHNPTLPTGYTLITEATTGTYDVSRTEIIKRTAGYTDPTTIADWTGGTGTNSGGKAVWRVAIEPVTISPNVIIDLDTPTISTKANDVLPNGLAVTDDFAAVGSTVTEGSPVTLGGNSIGYFRTPKPAGLSAAGLSSAKLKVFIQTLGTADIEPHSVVGWRGDAGGFTFASPTSPIVDAAGLTAGAYAEFDVTAVVLDALNKGKSNLDIALYTYSGTNHTIQTMEGANPPVLDIAYTIPAVTVTVNADTPTASIKSIEPTVTVVNPVNIEFVAATPNATVKATDPTVTVVNPVHAVVEVGTPTVSAQAKDAAFEEIRTAVLVPTSDAYRAQGSDAWVGSAETLEINYNPAANLSAVIVPQGTAAQNLTVNKALSRCDFPLEVLQPYIQARYGRNYVPVTFEELGLGESGGSVLGEFRPDGTIVLDDSIEADVEQATWTLLHEIAHLVDVCYLTNTQRVNIWNALHTDSNDFLTQTTQVVNGVALDHGHGWLGYGDYFSRVGEAFANAFVRAYSDTLSLNVFQFDHPATNSAADKVRGIITPDLPRLIGPFPTRTPAVRLTFDALPASAITGTILSANLRLNVRYNTGGEYGIKTLYTQGRTAIEKVKTTTLAAGTRTVDVKDILDPKKFNAIQIDSGSISQNLILSATEDPLAGTEPTLTVRYVVNAGAVVEDAATATATLDSYEATAEVTTNPNAIVDVETVSATLAGGTATVRIPVTVSVDDTDTVLLGAYNPEVEIRTSAYVDLDTPRVLATHIRVADVNGEPVLPSETEDPYFESTWRTLRGYRVGTGSLDESLAYWFRFNERAGLEARDRAYVMADDKAQGQAVLDLSNVTIGLNDGPDGRHHFYFNGDAYAAQREPAGTADEYFYRPTSLEFTFRTSRKTQFLMGGSDIEGGRSSDAVTPPWELWMVDGYLELRQYAWNGTYVTVRGFTNLADNKWHHVVIQKSHEGGATPETEFLHETYVDGRLEVRRRRGPQPLGFPDFIGGRIAGGYELSLSNNPFASLDRSYWFLGDMTEVIFRNGRVLNDDEIALQRDNVMGIKAVRPDTARIVTTANDKVVVKGNKPRLLILDFGVFDEKTGANTNARLTTFRANNQVNVTADDLLFVNAGSEIQMDFPGWGETETPHYPSWQMGEFLWFRKSVMGYFDEVTDNHRVIDLTKDLNMDDYDLITVIGYPRNESSWFKYDVLDLYNSEPKVPMRKQLETLMGQIREQVTFNRKGLYITDPFSAIALGIIDKVDYVPNFREMATFDERLGAVTGIFDWHSYIIDPFFGDRPDATRQELPDPRDKANRNRAARYQDTHLNIKQRVRNVIEGLTTRPGWIKTDEIQWWNVNPFAQIPYQISRRFEHRPFGLQVGDEFYMIGGEQDQATWREFEPVDTYLGRILDRENGWVAAPMRNIKVGVAVTTFGRVFQATTEEDVDKAIGNPYQDHAVSIAAQPGDLWNGKQINGKVYVNFTESDVWNPEQMIKSRIQNWEDYTADRLAALQIGDVIRFFDGGEWTITAEHARYNFSTHYGSFQGSEVNLPNKEGGDWGWSPGGKRGSSGGGSGSGNAWQARWRSLVPLDTIETPSMANRAIKWLASDLDIEGNANVIVGTADINTEAIEAEAVTERNTVVDLSTARVVVEAHSDADTIDPDVTVMASTPTVRVEADALVTQVDLSTATILARAHEFEYVADVDYSEALVLTLPRQILTLTMEDA